VNELIGGVHNSRQELFQRSCLAPARQSPHRNAPIFGKVQPAFVSNEPCSASRERGSYVDKNGGNTQLISLDASNDSKQCGSSWTEACGCRALGGRSQLPLGFGLALGAGFGSVFLASAGFDFSGAGFEALSGVDVSEFTTNSERGFGAG